MSAIVACFSALLAVIASRYCSTVVLYGNSHVSNNCNSSVSSGGGGGDEVRKGSEKQGSVLSVFGVQKEKEHAYSRLLGSDTSDAQDDLETNEARNGTNLSP